MTAPFAVGIAGVGAMATRHAEAVLDAGGTVAGVLVRPDSPRREGFVQAFSPAEEHHDPASFARAAAHWDAAVVAVSTGSAPDVTMALLPAGIPLLLEKPGATSSEGLEPFRPAADRILVAYNRRFYAPVLAARAFVQEGDRAFVTATLPELVWDTSRDAVHPILEKAVHTFDLLHFLVGPLELRSVLRSGSADAPGFAAVAESGRGDVVTIVSAWGAPANAAVDIARRGERFELRPHEVGVRYDGMDVVPPEPSNPIKRYQPRPAEEVTLEPADLRCKPGFRRQIDALADLAAGRPVVDAARLDDAVAALRLAEDLLGATDR